MPDTDFRLEAREIESNDFLEDVLAGFSAESKSLPCKYFYDERGSELFEKICATEDYYVTRTETQLLRKIVPEVAEMLGEDCDILEFGSGAGEKIRLLLDALQNPTSYTPMDISEEVLHRSAEELRTLYPNLDIRPWVGDYTQNLSAKLEVVERRSQRVVFFPGSTISNFTPDEAQSFLKRIGLWLGEGGVLLIGVDTVKSEQILNAAYNDADGYTAAFNLNLLHRMESELDTNINPDNFSHFASFNEEKSRIEMHLVSDKTHSINVDGQQVSFEKGEKIHTENSYKYRVSEFESLAESAGFSVVKYWVADKNMFSFYYLESNG